MGREDGRALRDVPGKSRNMTGARQELLSDMWLYEAGEGLTSAFPGLLSVFRGKNLYVGNCNSDWWETMYNKHNTANLCNKYDGSNQKFSMYHS